jgi:ferritin-like metal-binding protein YciE
MEMLPTSNCLITDPPPTRDVELILMGQKVEHYEIFTYGGLAQLARNLGHDAITGLLEQTLEEEKADINYPQRLLKTA